MRDSVAQWRHGGRASAISSRTTWYKIRMSAGVVLQAWAPRKLLRRVGPVLALCAALLALTGAFAASLILSGAGDRYDHSSDVQQPGAAESTDEHTDSSPIDGWEENPAEEVEALPARPAPTQSFLRQTTLTSSRARIRAGWLKIETPPPRT